MVESPKTVHITSNHIHFDFNIDYSDESTLHFLIEDALNVNGLLQEQKYEINELFKILNVYFSSKTHVRALTVLQKYLN